MDSWNVVFEMAVSSGAIRNRSSHKCNITNELNKGKSWVLQECSKSGSKFDLEITNTINCIELTIGQDERKYQSLENCLFSSWDGPLFWCRLKFFFWSTWWRGCGQGLFSSNSSPSKSKTNAVQKKKKSDTVVVSIVFLQWNKFLWLGWDT